jgi:hypothetical protein
MLHFKLSREEHLFSMRVEKLGQLGRGLALPRIWRPNLGFLTSEVEIVVF